MKTRMGFVAIFVVAIAAMVALGTPASAAITDVSASASNWGPYGGYSYMPIYAARGQGLTGEQHTAANGNNAWLTADARIAGEYYIVDLKKNYTLDAANTLRVWNYNIAPASYHRGVKTATFYASLDAVNWTAVSGWTTTGVTSGNTFDEAPGTDDYASDDYINFNSTPTARYVKIVVGSNYGGNVTGLSEVQVFGTYASDPQAALGTPLTVAAVTASIAGWAGYGTAPIGSLIDGSGLSGLGHDVDLGWPCDGNQYWNWGSTSRYIDFDLGAAKPLKAMRVWNLCYLYHEGECMRTVDIFVSNDPTFTGVTPVHDNLELLLPQTDGTGNYFYDCPQIIYLPKGTVGQYVRISTVGNSKQTYGSAEATGLAEVQFFEAPPPPPAAVPEPATLPLLGLALLGLRKRRS